VVNPEYADPQPDNTATRPTMANVEWMLVLMAPHSPKEVNPLEVRCGKVHQHCTKFNA